MSPLWTAAAVMAGPIVAVTAAVTLHDAYRFRYQPWRNRHRRR